MPAICGAVVAGRRPIYGRPAAPARARGRWERYDFLTRTAERWSKDDGEEEDGGRAASDHGGAAPSGATSAAAGRALVGTRRPPASAEPADDEAAFMRDVRAGKEEWYTTECGSNDADSESEPDEDTDTAGAATDLAMDGPVPGGVDGSEERMAD
eukprot:gene28241-16600_t